MRVCRFPILIALAFAIGTLLPTPAQALWLDPVTNPEKLFLMAQEAAWLAELGQWQWAQFVDSAMSLPGSDPIFGDGQLRYKVPLFSFSGPGIGIEVTATYNSAASNQMSIIGHGWDFSLNQRLILDPIRGYARIYLATGAASNLAFVRSGVAQNRTVGGIVYTVQSYSPMAQGVPYVLEEWVDPNAVRTWKLQDESSVLRQFEDSAGYLTQIIHPTGQSIQLTWEKVKQGDPTGSPMQINYVKDSAGRFYYFNYYPDGPNGEESVISQDGKVKGRFLKCIGPTEDDCTAPYAYFDIGRALGDNWGTLNAIQHPSNHSDIFEYDLASRPMVMYAPDNQIKERCDQFCDDDAGAIPAPVCTKIADLNTFCDNLANDMVDHVGYIRTDGCYGFCKATWRQYNSTTVVNACYPENCRDPGKPLGPPCTVDANCAMGFSCVDGHCLADVAYSEPLCDVATEINCVCNNVINPPGPHAPGWTPCADPIKVCKQPITDATFCNGFVKGDQNKHQTCHTGCENYYQSLKPRPGILYGNPSDLRFNLKEIYTADTNNGNYDNPVLVLKNWYGSDEYSPDFDKVIQQQLGPGDPNNANAGWFQSHVLRFEYHDMDVEFAPPIVGAVVANQSQNYIAAAPNVMAARLVDSISNMVSLYVSSIQLTLSDYSPIQPIAADINWKPAPFANTIDYVGGALAPAFNDTWGLYIENLSTFTPTNVCPATCTLTQNGVCVQATYAAATPIIPGPDQIIDPQLMPHWAVVTYFDSNATTQYFNSIHAERLLRQDNRHLTDGRAITKTEYVHSNGYRTGVLTPSGMRSCAQIDPVGRPLEVTALAAPNKTGAAVPIQAHYEYDSIGEVVHTWRTASGTTLSETQITRDPAERVTQSLTAKGPSGQVLVYLTTTSSYTQTPTAPHNTASPVAPGPSQVTYPDGSKTDFSSYATSGGVGKIVVNSNAKRGPAVVARINTYDSRGHVSTTGLDSAGTVDATYDRGNSWTEYDAASRPIKVSQYLKSNTTPIVTNYTYDSVAVGNDVFNSGTGLWPNSIATAKVQTLYDYDVYGHVLATRQIGLQNGGTSNHCYKRRISDGQLLEEILPEGNQVRYSYDNDGNVTKTEKGYPAAIPSWAARCSTNLGADPDKVAGLETTYQADYDSAGLLTHSITGGIDSYFDRDGFGRTVETRDALGNRVRTGFDTAGRVAWEATYVAGAPAYATPNATVAIPATLRAATEFTYDMMDRVLTSKPWRFTGTTSNSGNANDPRETTTITYDEANGKVTTVVGGQTLVQIHDGAQRKTSDCLNALCTTRSTPAGATADLSVTETRKNPTGTVSTVDLFDELGRHYKTHDGTGNQRELSSTVYQLDGTVDQRSSATDGILAYTHDSFGRVLSESRDAGGNLADETRYYTWDLNGRLKTVFDGGADSKPTNQHFDGLDRLTRSTDPLTHDTTYTYYTGSARLWKRTDPAGTVMESIYNTAGLMNQQKVTHGAGLKYAGVTTVHDFTYNAFGQVLTAAVSGNANDPLNGTTVTRTYDSHGQLLTDSDSKFAGLKTTNTYNRYGRVLTTKIGNRTITTAYQADGRQSSLKFTGVATTTLATFAYTNAGGPTKAYLGGATQAAGGLIETFSYDRLGYLTQVSANTWNANMAAVTKAIATQTDYVSLGGIPLERKRTFAAASAMTDVYRVDDMGRLNGENLQFTSGVTPPASYVTSADVAPFFVAGPNTARTLYRSFTLDSSSNWTDIAMATSTAHANLDNFNRVTSFTGTGGHPLSGITPTYDNASDAKTMGALGSYEFDGHGRLIHGTRSNTADVDWGYDGLGRRVYEHDAKAATYTYFVYNGGALLGWGNNAALATPPSVDQLTLRAGSLALVRRESGADKIRYLAQGPDGSALALFDSTGLLEGYAYTGDGDVFYYNSAGASIASSAFGYNIRLFQAEPYNASLRTVAMGARVYLPEARRWLSPDPGGIAADGPNLFAFVGGRSLHNIDPTGFDRGGIPEFATWGVPDDMPGMSFDSLGPGGLEAIAALVLASDSGTSPAAEPPAGNENQTLDDIIVQSLDDILPGGSEGVTDQDLLDLVQSINFSTGTTVIGKTNTPTVSFSSPYGKELPQTLWNSLGDTRPDLRQLLTNLENNHDIRINVRIDQEKDQQTLSKYGGGLTVAKGDGQYTVGLNVDQLAALYCEHGTPLDLGSVLAHELGHILAETNFSYPVDSDIAHQFGIGLENTARDAKGLTPRIGW